jgi:DNA-binding transcriptional MerR regulator
VDQMSIGEFARRSRLSPKALRLYDGLGLLSPARVDDVSGYRYYEQDQLDQARLIASLRHVEVPLAIVKEWLALDPPAIADRVTEFWRGVETGHAGKRDLVAALVDQLTGRSIAMEVSTREMPQRSILCLKRNVNEPGAWAFGKEFIGIIRDPRLPRLEGREGAVFSIYWAQVSADSDGPVEWCKPVPEAEAEALAEQFPELTLRIEPAHREAYVALGYGERDPAEGLDPTQWPLVEEALRKWADDYAEPAQLALAGNLGVRITYLATGTASDRRAPDCDFAVPFA